MSRVDELIKKLCPNGVEFVPLNSVAELQRGNSITKKSINDGNVPVIAGGRSIAYFHDTANRDGETIVVAGSGAYAGFVSWWEVPIFVSDAFSIKVNQSELDAKYCFYFLKHKQETLHNLKRGSGVAHVYPKDVGMLKIPVPPLEIQQEIARILDKFTQLEAELEAELEARRKQYAYYRRELLGKTRQGGWTTIGTLSTNRNAVRQPIKKDDRVPGKYPYYGASGVVDYVKGYIFDGSYLLISEDGANLKARTYPIAFSIEGKNWVNNHAHVLEFLSYTEQKFVEYYINFADLTPYISGAAQPKLSKKNLESIPIPVLPFEEQRRIVAILDKFDALVNDISTGLPAEIAARRKQYEYYRDKLLSFEPAAAAQQ